MAPPGVPADSSYWPLAAKSALACQYECRSTGARASPAGGTPSCHPAPANSSLRSGERELNRTSPRRRVSSWCHRVSTRVTAELA